MSNTRDMVTRSPQDEHFAMGLRGIAQACPSSIMLRREPRLGTGRSQCSCARVGRYSDGRQCENWADDQKTVIELLNAIHFDDGGAQKSVGGQVISGSASNDLWFAIKRFEERQFPT